MREKTNSITHLVKIVAREEIQEKIADLGRLNKQVLKLFARVDELSKRVTTIDASDFLNEIKTNLEKAGAPWSQAEHDLLVQEVRTAIATIAKNHNRSKGAITSRIDQYRLTKG